MVYVFVIVVVNVTIVENMHLTMGARNGAFYGPKGNLMAFDPSTSMQGPNSLLIKMVIFDKVLKDKKLGLLWVFYGQKDIYNRKIDHSDGRQVIRGAIAYLGNKFRSGSTASFHSRKGQKTLLFKRTN